MTQKRIGIITYVFLNPRFFFLNVEHAGSQFAITNFTDCLSQ